MNPIRNRSPEATAVAYGQRISNGVNRPIILVNPWIHDFSAYDLWLKPLGLLYIGSYLEKAGYNVKLIDCLDYQKTPKEYGCNKFYSEEITKPYYFQHIPRKYKRYGMPPTLFSRILTETNDSPLLFMVTSMMTYWYPGVFETIKYIKQVFSETPVVLGGVYATLCYEHAKRYSGADYVIKGRGEEAVLQLVEKLSESGGVTHRTSNPQGVYPGRVIRNPTSLFPAYHYYNDIKSVAMVTSRGCPFRCSYCASAALSETFSQRPPEEVVAEIEYYCKVLGITDIVFYDDALFVNHENHFDIILEQIISRKINERVRFHTPNGLHIRYIDKTLAQRLYQANFRTIRLGFESTERDKDSDYKVSKENLLAVINYLKESGFSARDIGVYVLMGLPDQNLVAGGDPVASLQTRLWRDEVERSIEFVHKCGAPVRIAQYSPVPGSRDYEKSLSIYPEIADEPLLHNKSVYYVHERGKRYAEFEALKLKARKLNHRYTQMNTD